MFAGTLSWHKDEVMQSMYLLYLIMYSHQEPIASLKNGWQLKSGGEIWAGEEGMLLLGLLFTELWTALYTHVQCYVHSGYLLTSIFRHRLLMCCLK